MTVFDEQLTRAARSMPDAPITMPQRFTARPALRIRTGNRIAGVICFFV